MNDAPEPTTSTGEKRSNIDPKVKSIIVEHLGVDADKVTDNAHLYDDLGADSLDQIELIMAFEEEFGVEIPDDHGAKIEKVSDITDYIVSHK